MAVLLKHAAKIIAVGDANAFGNAGNGKLRVGKQPLGASNAVTVQIVDGWHTHLGAKAAVHIVNREIDTGCQLLLGNVLGVILMDVVQNFLCRGRALLALRLLLKGSCVKGQQSEKSA